MSGISDKAIKSNYAENKYRFTGQLYDDDLDWDTYQMKYRTMDPQLGRFWQVDPLASKYPYNSTFAYAENRVINGIDLEGAEYFQPPTQAQAQSIAHVVNPKDFPASKINEVAKGEVQGQTEGAKVALPLMVAASLDPPYAIPFMISYMSGVPVTPSPQAMAGSMAAEGTVAVDEVGYETSTSTSTVNTSGDLPKTTLQQNAEAGAAWENQVGVNLGENGRTDITPQITIKADNGVKTRVDFLSFDQNGMVKIDEAKSSATAPLTKNQTSAFPSIEKSGGTVVGKGKPPFVGGTKIPPTKVNIVRKDN
jgi:RHS repeat-associated protein